MPWAEDMDRQGQPEIGGVDDFQDDATDRPHQLDPRTRGRTWDMLLCLHVWLLHAALHGPSVKTLAKQPASESATQNGTTQLHF